MTTIPESCIIASRLIRTTAIPWPLDRAGTSGRARNLASQNATQLVA